MKNIIKTLLLACCTIIVASIANAKEATPITDLNAPLGLELNNTGSYDQLAGVYFINKKPGDKFKPSNDGIVGAGAGLKSGEDPTSQVYKCPDGFQLCQAPLVGDRGSGMCGDMFRLCKCPNAYKYVESNKMQREGDIYCPANSKLGGKTCVDPRWSGTRYSACECDDSYQWTSGTGKSTDCQSPKVVSGASCTAEGYKVVDGKFASFKDDTKYQACKCDTGNYPYTYGNCNGEYSLQGNKCTDQDSKGNNVDHYTDCGCNVSGIECPTGHECSSWSCGGTVCTGCSYVETCEGEVACSADKIATEICRMDGGSGQPRYRCDDDPCKYATLDAPIAGQDCTQCTNGKWGCTACDSSYNYTSCPEGYKQAGGTCGGKIKCEIDYCSVANRPPYSAITFTPGTPYSDGDGVIKFPYSISVSAPYRADLISIVLQNPDTPYFNTPLGYNINQSERFWYMKPTGYHGCNDWDKVLPPMRQPSANIGFQYCQEYKPIISGIKFTWHYGSKSVGYCYINPGDTCPGTQKGNNLCKL